MNETVKRPGSEIVRQLMTGFSFQASPENCDVTLGECLDLYRALLLREAAEISGKIMPPPAASEPAEGKKKAPSHGRPSAWQGVEKQGFITGRGTTEKREIADRLDAYCQCTGLGAAQRIADASRKKLTRDDVLLMKERRPFPMETWRALAKALDRVEQAEKNVSDSDTTS